MLVDFLLQTELLHCESCGLVSSQILEEGVDVSVRLRGVLANLSLGPESESGESLNELLLGNTPLVVLLVSITDELFIALI